MKKINTYLILLVSAAFTNSLNAQTINWGSLQADHKHIANVTFGSEYGLVYGLGYGYHIHAKTFEIIPLAEYSFPSGNIILDDFKSKIGAQIRWVEYNNIMFSTRIQGIFRRQENDLVRLLNFGSDMATVIGYYHSKWFVSGEVGFDKAIVTNFRHSQKYRDQYADVVDGWYEPSTGGNFYFGFQGGYSFRQHDIYLKGGEILSQDFRTRPLLPFYLMAGYNLKIGKKAD